MATAANRPRCLVVMGVTGSGKSTVGRALAQRLGWAFFDADDYHPAANVEKMARGEPLTDADRAPWLERLANLIAHQLGEGRSMVLACSALRQAYRDQLEAGGDAVQFVWLRLGREEARRRLHTREGHFMPQSLIDSQFATLEPPVDALVLDAARPVHDLVEQAAVLASEGG